MINSLPPRTVTLIKALSVRMSKLAIGGLTALALVFLTACGVPVANPAITPSYDAVCVDPSTQMRVDDSWCDDAPDIYVAPAGGSVVFVDHHHAGWYYYDARSTVIVPSMGGRIVANAGSWNSPKATNINSGNTTINNITINRGGVDTKGGKASTVVVKKPSTQTTPPKPSADPNVSRGGFGVKTTVPTTTTPPPTFTKKSR